MSKTIKLIIKFTAGTIVLFFFLVAIYSVWFFANGKINNLSEEIKIYREEVSLLGKHFDKIVKELETKNEIARREIIREKSQEELLTAAVAAVMPSVVSVVVTKDVPKLEVVYINPFGDDPFFQDFNIRVPRFQQKGTELKRVGAGSGFLISSDGYVLTNRHVVEDAQAHYTVLLTDGSQKTAQVVYRDTDDDIAVVKIEGNGYKGVNFGNSDILKLGQSVFAVGNALGEYNNSVSVGIISGLNRSIEAVDRAGTEKLSGVIQTDAAINPGNSGGPLVDLQGKVVGVNVAMVQGSENIGFAIPIDTAKKIVNSFLAK